MAASATRHPGVEERRALVQRVLSSRSFEKSARMRDFLAYVCQRALQDPGADIHEQEIGCAVFGRPTEYDTGADNIVRVNASQVRKKLEAYFGSEGAREPLMLELPKGKYVPAFVARPVSAPAAASDRRLLFALASLCAALLTACLWMAILLRQTVQPAALARSAGLSALWGQLIRADSRTDVVVTDSSLGLMQDLLGREIPLAEYLQPDVWRADALAANPRLQAAARLAAHRHYTSLANINITRRILRLAGALEGQIEISSARDFQIRRFKNDTVILLGSKRANPWVELAEPQMNFRFGYDRASSISFFQNARPRPGEAEIYRNDPAISYCDVAFLPNLSKSGNMLIISGTEMEGTEAGGEFLTTERGMESLQRVVKAQANGRLPYFEVLLKSSKIGGAAPGVEVVAWRTAPAAP